MSVLYHMTRDRTTPFRTCSEKLLSRKHLDDLRESGLSDETIRACGFYTERDPKKVRRKLDWTTTGGLKNMGPFLAIPYRSLDGRPSDYTRYKPDNPRQSLSKDGKKNGVKYEAPRGRPTEPYFPPAVLDAIRTPGVDLFITEGEKKAAKAGQEGFPCIGLPGVTCWSKPRSKDKKEHPSGKRKLHDRLADIEWNDRRVFVVFDTDEKRNPNVAREEAELAYALEQRGAVVHLVHFPPCHNEKESRFIKQGFDDFLIRYGAGRFRSLLDDLLHSPKQVSLGTYRARLAKSYGRLTRPGPYVNRAPTGVGKTHQDIQHASETGRSLFLVPSHKQEADLISMGYENGLCIVPYPIRTEQNCNRFKCVLELEEMGFNPTAVLCPTCEYWPRKKANENGPPSPPCLYYIEYEEAKNAQHACATHQRFRLTGKNMALNRPFISVQEDAINVQAPVVTARSGFKKIADLVSWARRTDFKSNPFLCDEIYFVARYFDRLLKETDTTITVPENIYEWNFRHVDQLIYKWILKRDYLFKEYGQPRPRYLVRNGKKQEVAPYLNSVPAYLMGAFNPGAIRFIILVMSGCFSRIYLRVIETHEFERIVELVGILKIRLEGDLRMVFGDATADPRSVPPEFEEQLTDITPSERPEQLQEIIQYPLDITRSTKKERVTGIVRELLRLYPKCRNVGILTHHSLIDYLHGSDSLLTSSERNRIIKVDYFFGTESRGSNSWKKECDSLFVLGTPRPPEAAVQTRLLQMGNVEAARRTGDWSKFDYWSGRRQDGVRETVRTRGYRDHDWNAACRTLIHAELIQSVGRARPYNADGIPLTVVVTTADLGYPLADKRLALLNRKHMEKALPVYAALMEVGIPDCPPSPDPPGRWEWSKKVFEKLTASSSYKNPYKENLPLAQTRRSNFVSNAMTGEKLAEQLDESPRTIRDRLAALEQFGLLTRTGPRSGYSISEDNFDYFKTIGKNIIMREPPVSTRGQFDAPRPVPSFWNPRMKFARSGLFSLHLLTSAFRPDRPYLVPDVLMAAVHDGQVTYLVETGKLESFLDRHRDRTLIT